MNIGIIFAGGSGKRMNSGGIPKQFIKIDEVPIIVHTINVFEECEKIDYIVISCIESHIEYMTKLVNQYKLTKVKSIVKGGKTGQQSIYNALVEANKLKGNAEKKIVLIHDGVRPIIDTKLLEDNIESVKRYGTSITCVTQKETTIISENGRIIDDITNRNKTYIARAPQSFFLEDILEAHQKAIENDEFDLIDSCSMMKKYGKYKNNISIVNCKSDNIKITTPDDFYIAKALMNAKKNMEIFGIGGEECNY
ncbi:MAG: 2-C-methyl-D-erythritol 4-phosphate cytidylyltransferase [Bacilli bacterium]|nr:2-C-methyl-D-erythritol 4-phosphate cytidylyltransferase [Bacilli bacterium]